MLKPIIDDPVCLYRNCLHHTHNLENRGSIMIASLRKIDNITYGFIHTRSLYKRPVEIMM